MENNMFLILIIGHLLADFVLQTDSIVNGKKELEGRYFFLHWLHLFIVLVIGTHLFFNYKMVLLLSGFISIIHVLLDFLKVNIIIRYKKRFSFKEETLNIVTFFIDQIVHIIVLIAAWRVVTNMYSINISQQCLKIYNYIFPCGLLEIVNSKTLTTIIVYISVIFGGAIVVRLVIDQICGNLSTDQKRVGKYIGIFERALILTIIIYNGAIESVAFVLAAKSIARYKDLDKKEFSEYFLLGTLLSTLIAVAGGAILISVFHNKIVF